jgi:radical SAM protein with 4Fe4S-binding SPASM domain
MISESFIRKENHKQAGLWKDGAPLLNNLTIELTERCNNNCIHCTVNLPLNDKKAISRELETEDIKRILDEAAELGCLGVRFTGGEPFLRKDFEELYLYIRRLGMKVELFTNATLINSRIANLFEDIPLLSKIEITLYGMKTDTYESVTRVNGSFKAALHGISLLQDRDIPFILKWVCLPQNAGDEAEFDAWIRKIKWMDKQAPKVILLDFRNRRDSDEKNRLIETLRLTPEIVAERFIKLSKQEIFKSPKRSINESPNNNTKLFSCMAGLHSAVVDAYGNLQMCLALRHPDTIYNLRNGTLKDAMTNFFPQIREMKPEHPDYLQQCSKCSAKNLCESCPAKSWMEYSVLDKPVQYLCDTAHACALSQE